MPPFIMKNLKTLSFHYDTQFVPQFTLLRSPSQIIGVCAYGELIVTARVLCIYLILLHTIPLYISELALFGAP